jgi:hypothetical protein
MVHCKTAQKISRAAKALSRVVGNEHGAQAQAARKIGCGAGMVTRWMRGVTIPSRAWARAIERAYPTVKASLWDAAEIARAA